MTIQCPDIIRPVDPSALDPGKYAQSFSDAIVLTADRRILMQFRPIVWRTSPGRLTAFGGHVEPGETPVQAVIRELHEELGATVRPEDLISLGAVTEAETNHSEIVHGHFWHDRLGAINGCHEGEPVYFDRLADALVHPAIMDYAVWFLRRCEALGLIS